MFCRPRGREYMRTTTQWHCLARAGWTDTVFLHYDRWELPGHWARCEVITVVAFKTLTPCNLMDSDRHVEGM